MESDGMDTATKNIYIVLTDPGTWISHIIKLYTRAEYSHVSVSLDKDLEKMYSFGRLKPYNPFIGGFVHENVKWGTFKRFKKTQAAIYSLTLTDEQYQTIENEIKNICKDAKEYKFNVLGLLAVTLHVHVRRKKHFYCAEFVKYLFEQAEIDTSLPQVVKPIDFKKIDDAELQYSGLLNSYNLVQN